MLACPNLFPASYFADRAERVLSMLLPSSRTRYRVNATRTLRVSVATVAAALAVTGTLAGCGSDDTDSGSTTASGSVSATTVAPDDHAATPAASAAELQSTLTTFADPAVPATDKAKLVTDGDQRVALIERMNQGLANYEVSFTVTEVRQDGDRADADVDVTSPHGTMPGVAMTWEYDDGTWKISDASACTILGMARAACQP